MALIVSRLWETKTMFFCPRSKAIAPEEIDHHLLEGAIPLVVENEPLRHVLKAYSHHMIFAFWSFRREVYLLHENLSKELAFVKAHDHLTASGT